MEEGSTPPGRGVLSMQGLSHGVIRVDSEEKLSVLTLQDVGSVMPGGETDCTGLDTVPDPPAPKMTEHSQTEITTKFLI